MLGSLNAAANPKGINIQEQEGEVAQNRALEKSPPSG
jgi:hypothetical protein